MVGMKTQTRGREIRKETSEVAARNRNTDSRRTQSNEVSVLNRICRSGRFTVASLVFRRCGGDKEDEVTPLFCF